MARLLLMIPLLLMFAGCASGRRVQKMETSMNVLENKVSSIEQRQGVLEGQTGESRESVGYLKGRVEGASKGSSTVVVTGMPNENCAQGVTKKSLSKKEIQIALKNAGFYNGNVDGKIGKDTKNAIKEFQKANGLHVDGVVGKKTRMLLAQHLTQ